MLYVFWCGPARGYVDRSYRSLSEGLLACMYALQIVSPLGEEHEDSSGAEAETLARCGRRVWRVIMCKVSFVLLSGKSILVTTFLISIRHFISLWLEYDPFYLCSSGVCRSLVP